MNKNATYLPYILLYGEVTVTVRTEFYPDKEFDTDEFWAGGLTPRYYRWEKTINITQQSHSSTKTRANRLYNGLDVFTGMWISDVYGNSLKIIKVISKSPTNIVVLLEDVDRVNTFKDTGTNGNGDLKGAQVIIFKLDDEDMPIIPLVPSEMSSAASLPSFISARFQTWNPSRRYRINKLGHDFDVNDVVVLNQNTHSFEKATTNNTNFPVIGTVLEVYPNKFFISPVNRIVSGIEPALPGNIGDYVYYDYNTGGYTNTPSEKRLFVKLTNSFKSYINGLVDSPNLTISDRFKVNNVEYTISSTDINDIINMVNNDTSSHGVSMSTIAGATIAQSQQAQLLYQVIGIILPATASINGQTIVFNNDTSGSTTFGPGMADHNDIVNDINAANIPDITASYEGGNIILKNNSGGDIIIQNIASDSSGTPFAGNSSCTGIPLETLSSGSSFKVYMERNDGGPITLEDIDGTPTEDMGLFSVQNGKLPEGLIIENWNRVGQTYVVDNMIGRDNIYPIFTGDTVMVLDSGNGEWVKYMYVNGSFVITATQDSARTDADVLSIEITHDNNGITTLGTVSNNSRVTDVTIEVIEPFSEDASISVGDVDINDRLISDSIVDLTTIGVYSNQPSHVYNTGSDVDINIYLNTNGSTTGRIKVILSYS